MATPAPVASTQVAANSAFGGPTPAQAAAANAALAAAPATATAPATIPTTAPTGQTATNAPPATPTTVVSSQPASTNAQAMVGTLTQAQQDLANQQSAKASAAYNAANPPTPTPAGGKLPGSNTANAGQPGYDVYGNPVQTQTPEQQIAGQPDTGNQFIYSSSGAQSQVPIGSAIPPGYSTTNPVAGPQLATVDSTTDPVGNVIKQFTDGTYGKFNAAGAYVGTASATDFTNSKNGESLVNSMNEVANGTYPLTANQQAQVDGIKAQFASLIATQQVANANLTGGTTVAENLYGMGTSLSGLGEIKGTVDSGLAKIADLNSQMNSAVAQMEAGFQTDDMNLLKSAYDTYSSTVQARQTELDTIQAAAAKALSDAQAQQQQAAEFAQTEQDKVTASITNTQDEAAKGGAPASVLAAIGSATNATDAINAAGQYLQASTDPDVANYMAYASAAKAAGQTPVPFESYQNTVAYNKAFATAKGDAAGKAAGTPQPAVGTGVTQGSITSKASFPQDLQPYANQSASGSWYVDLSGASASQRAALAAQVGPDVTVITDKNQAADLKNQTDAISKLNIIAKVYADIAQPSALARDLGGAGLTSAEIAAQTDPKKAAALAVNDSALDILKAISGVQGFRGNASAVANIVKALPQPGDTQDVAAGKLQAVALQIQAREQATLGANLGPDDYTQFTIRSEQQSQAALTAAGQKDPSIQQNITKTLNTTNPATGQPYTYTEAAQILGVDVPQNTPSAGGLFSGGNLFSTGGMFGSN